MSHPITNLRQALGLAPIPYQAFGTWPSPVRLLPALSQELAAAVWLKDDGVASDIYGGNKTRKLELLLAEAVTKRATSVVTIGAIGSNQVLGTAVLARQLGLAVKAIVYPRPGKGGTTSASDVEKMALATARGAALVPSSFDQVGTVFDDLLDEAPDAYVIPAGGSTPLGNLAFAAAAFELREQIDAALLPLPDDIYVPLGTGGTAVGLAVGCALAGVASRIVGVRVAGDDSVSHTSVERQTKACFARLRALGFQGPERAAEIMIVDDQLGAGYGEPTAEGAQAITRLAALEGLTLEPTYTAKTMAALIAARENGASGNVLFWQTANSVALTA